VSSRKYGEPADFKQALENHLKKHAAAAGVDIKWMRQRWVFERFLARLTLHFGDRVILKGGVALALRLPGARFTRDVDLRFSGSPERLAVELSAMGALRIDEDFLSITVEPDPKHPTIEADGLKYGGQRFRVEAALAGKVYGTRFGVDVVFGEAMARPAEIIPGSDLFAFASIPPIQILAHAREVHLAEKLHAFTALRARENTRVKDLPDIALLALTGPFEGQAVRATIQSTFDARGTHALPVAVPLPPESWRVPYARMAQENHLRWASLEEITQVARAFLDPVLRGEDGTWNPLTWTWRRGT
jgi:nucleotidyltransferase AbiEii toxin of type IV toxin-antitoxin system